MRRHRETEEHVMVSTLPVQKEPLMCSIVQARRTFVESSERYRPLSVSNAALLQPAVKRYMSLT